MTSKTALFPPVDPLPLLALFISPLFAAEHYAVKVERGYSAEKCEMASFVPISIDRTPDGEISRSPPAHSLQQNWLEHEFRNTWPPGAATSCDPGCAGGRYAPRRLVSLHPEAEDGYDTVEWGRRLRIPTAR